ncbi:MAG: hypothetical protein JKY54_16340 [Flavobacteriales bacterium]|nr:hypothetical protein [Flavobacteriales bacterium]
MKSTLLTLTLCFGVVLLGTAQNVGINNTGATPNSYAMLDIASSTNNKGILIPRLTTVERSGIGGLGLSEEGLTVYDETTNGYWLWDGTQWIQFMMAGDAWNLNGNAGTTPGTDFIGTTDAQDWIVKTNNTSRIRVYSGGRTEFLSTTDASGLTNTGVIEIANSLRLDGNEIITNTNTPLYIQNDNGGDAIMDGSTFHMDASTDRVGIGTATPTDKLTVAGWIGRTAHNNGGLVGSYNSIGANSSQSNPIYVIGSSYKPAATTLGNMYGTGYSHTNASFINGGGSWGYYVAADGDARIWLAASSGGDTYFNTGGYFGINTSAPTRAFDVNGTVRIRGGGPTAGDFLMSQDGSGNATWSASGYGLIPIGSIVGWHGNMAGVPGLPAGWYECNGQAVSDAASPMNGQAVPNLNNATTSESGDVSRGRFLRGNTTSGWFQTDLANNLDWVNHDDSGNGDSNDFLDDDGTVITIRNYSTSGDRFQLNVDGYETRVTNMTVRWIIRIK